MIDEWYRSEDRLGKIIEFTPKNSSNLRAKQYEVNNFPLHLFFIEKLQTDECKVEYLLKRRLVKEDLLTVD